MVWIARTLSLPPLFFGIIVERSTSECMPFYPRVENLCHQSTVSQSVNLFVRSLVGWDGEARPKLNTDTMMEMIGFHYWSAREQGEREREIQICHWFRG